jgi:hypothetical protein
MGTRKPGSSTPGSLEDLPFDDDFWVPYYLKNDLSREFCMAQNLV